MAHDKRYVAQKRQKRRIKAVKVKIKLVEAGKMQHADLPELAKTLYSRKQRVLKRAE